MIQDWDWSSKSDNQLPTKVCSWLQPTPRVLNFPRGKAEKKDTKLKGVTDQEIQVQTRQV